MPPQKLLDQGKRSKLFITSQGYPRYCQLETQADGSVVLKGGRSKRGKYRNPPSGKTWAQAMKGCEDVAFVDFLRRCLVWDPEARISPREALKHDWMRRRPYIPGQAQGQGQGTMGLGQAQGTMGLGQAQGFDGPMKTMLAKTQQQTQANDRVKKEKTYAIGVSMGSSGEQAK